MKRYRWLPMLMAFILTVALFPLTAHAVGVSVSASSSSVKVGDTVSVTVTFSGTSIFGASANFSYDSSVLSYQGGANTSDGRIVLVSSVATGESYLRATISFKALKVGNSTISVSCYDSYNANLESLGTGSGGASITVTDTVGNADPTQAPTKKPTATPKTTAKTTPKTTVKATATKKPTATPSPSPTPVPVSQREIPAQAGESTVYIWHTIPQGVTAPEGYEVTQGAWADEAIQTLTHPDTGVVLVYATDETGENGAFYAVFGDGIQPYQTLTGSALPLVILETPEGVEIPVEFTPAVLSIDTAEYPAYQASGDADMYLLYACAPDGTVGFYLYDAAFGTVLRYSAEALYPEAEDSGLATLTPAPTQAAPVVTAEPEKLPFAVSGLPWILCGILALISCGLAYLLFVPMNKKGRRSVPKQPKS